MMRTHLIAGATRPARMKCCNKHPVRREHHGINSHSLVPTCDKSLLDQMGTSLEAHIQVIIGLKLVHKCIANVKLAMLLAMLKCCNCTYGVVLWSDYSD